MDLNGGFEKMIGLDSRPPDLRIFIWINIYRSAIHAIRTYDVQPMTAVILFALPSVAPSRSASADL